MQNTLCTLRERTCPGPAAVANGSAFAFATYDWEGEGFPHGGD